MADSVTIDESELRKRVGDAAFRVLRHGDTERPFTGKLLTKNKETGTYDCIACGNPLFLSEHKFDSGCGWPAFYDAANKDAVRFLDDHSLGMSRTEVRCGRCDSHLGHIFNDGYGTPTGQRYCINSCCLDFKTKTTS